MFEMYNGFGIAKFDDGDSYYPWQIGRKGNIYASAHTKKEARAIVDTMQQHKCPDCGASNYVRRGMNAAVCAECSGYFTLATN